MTGVDRGGTAHCPVGRRFGQQGTRAVEVDLLPDVEGEQSHETPDEPDPGQRERPRAAFRCRLIA
jgi:hypothetical protein